MFLKEYYNYSRKIITITFIIWGIMLFSYSCSDPITRSTIEEPIFTTPNIMLYDYWHLSSIPVSGDDIIPDNANRGKMAQNFGGILRKK